MTVKRYGLSGIGSTIEMGKGGLKLKNNGVQLEALANDGLTLVEMRAADGTTAQSVVTKTQLDTKQNTLSIEAGSQNYLQLEGDVLSVKNLLIQDVHVDNSALNLAQFVASGYAGSEFQEGDILILAASTDAQQRVYIHNGGTANDATDFTRLQVDLSEAVIRGMFSGGTGIAYNSTTGEIVVDATSAEITADDAGFTVISGANAQAVFASIDAALVDLDGRVDALEASMAEVDVASIAHFNKLAFDFQSGASFNLGDAIPAGRAVVRALVKVVTPFDDAASTLELGKSGDTNLIMTSTHIDLLNAGVYSVELFEDMAIATQLLGTMNVGTSTQGDGSILIEYC